MSSSILEQFYSEQNFLYLVHWGVEHGITIVEQDLYNFASSARILSNDFWPEVRRLNNAFKISMTESVEPYHIQMFENDSLRPKGLEFLNDSERNANRESVMAYSDYYTTKPSSSRYPQRRDYFPIWQRASRPPHEKETENTMGIEYGTIVRGYDMSKLYKSVDG